MRIYTVHQEADGAAPVLVKEGLCWPAALFTVLWALWHRLWGAALVMAAAAVALATIAAVLGLDSASRTALAVGYGLAVGFVAGDLRRRGLERRGARFVGVVCGADRAAAEHRALDVLGVTAAAS